jgi:polyisoprenoid-binding protein YceI
MTPTAAPTEPALLPAGTWRVDSSRSRVGFCVHAIGLGTLRGAFEEFEGAVGPHSAAGSVRTGSLATGDRARDRRLLATGIFAADVHPHIDFRASGINALGHGIWEIVGDLTLSDVTREIKLFASHASCAEDRRRLRVLGTIDRRDFGVTFGPVVEASGLVGTAITIDLEIELVAFH